MSYCTGCGTALDAGDGFCRKCGRQVGPSLPATPMAAPPVSVQNVYRGKNMRIAGGIVIVVGVLIALSACADPASSTGTAMFGGLVFCVGIALNIAGKFSHWYHAE